jgi:hypothetical protein
MAKKNASDGCDVGGIQANPKNLRAQRRAPASETQVHQLCFRAWAEPIFVGSSLAGHIIAVDQGWAVFSVSGDLIGIRQRRAAAVVALTHGVAR